MRPLRTTALALSAVCALGLLGGCRQPSPTASAPAKRRPVVAATIFPLASLVADLVGDSAEVVTLAPSAASPHTLDLTPDTARQLASANLLVRVGPGLDDWVAQLASAKVKVFTAMDHATLMDGNPEADHEHGAPAAARDAGPSLAKDPHLWLDPDLVAREVVPALAAELVAMGLPGVAQRQAALQSRLAALDKELAAKLKPLAQRRYAGAHPAWRYFNRRYALEMVATVEPVGGTEPSARWLREAIETTKAKGAACVFTEVQLSGKLDSAVAKEAGVRLGVLDPIGGPDVPGRDSYEAMLRYNAQSFVTGLGGS